MRRATAALIGTLAGTALLVGAKFGTAGAASGTGVSAATPLDPSGAASTPPAGGSGATSAPPAGSSGATKGSGGSGSGSGSRGGTSTGTACRTRTGDAVDVVQPGIGAVTVTVKVCGGTLSAASGSLSESDWRRNTAAIPALDTMAVRYYKTDVSQIHYSGATLTSHAYQASLRSALDAAG